MTKLEYVREADVAFRLASGWKHLDLDLIPISGLVLMEHDEPHDPDKKPPYPGPEIAPLTAEQADAKMLECFPGAFIVKEGEPTDAIVPIKSRVHEADVAGALIPIGELPPSRFTPEEWRAACKFAEEYAEDPIEAIARDVEQIAKAFDERWQVLVDFATHNLIGRLDDEAYPLVPREAIDDNLYCRVATERLLEWQRLIAEKREAEVEAARRAERDRLRAVSKAVDAEFKAEDEAKRWREDPPHRICAPRAPGRV